jgi:hypothetical protein
MSAAELVTEERQTEEKHIREHLHAMRVAYPKRRMNWQQTGHAW